VQTRTVPQESVAYWVDRIAELEAEVEEVLNGEYEDKALRVAEMEATKAVNVLEHRDEIYGRPARSWFQTNDEKEASAKRSKHEGPTAARSEAPVVEVVKPKIKRDKYAGLTRKQRRARQRAELFAKDEEEAVEGGGDFRVRNQMANPRPNPNPDPDPQPNPNPNPTPTHNPNTLTLTLTLTLTRCPTRRVPSVHSTRRLGARPSMRSAARHPRPQARARRPSVREVGRTI